MVKLGIRKILFYIIAVLALTACEDEKNTVVSTYTVGGVSFNMVEIEGGSFFMGAQCLDEHATGFDSSAASRETPVHEVTLSHFSLGETEVTQALWMAVMHKDLGWDTECGINDSLPVYYVNYNEANEFIKVLNDSLHRSGQLNASRNFSLPSEAQWEYAARGGQETTPTLYAGSNNIYAVGWVKSNSKNKLHKVAQLESNELGLFDMSGNVWEWCADYSNDYTTDFKEDPVSQNVAPQRILRGGSYAFEAQDARVTCRGSNFPVTRDYNLGFRLCLN